MEAVVSPQTLELLAWIASRPRTYAEAVEAWGTHCPRHPVWEDALSERFIQVVGRDVSLTAQGRAALDED
jgi:D-3-phosphoglycerate dehydrogenase